MFKTLMVVIVIICLIILLYSVYKVFNYNKPKPQESLTPEHIDKLIEEIQLKISQAEKDYVSGIDNANKSIKYLNRRLEQLQKLKTETFKNK